ncbi:MAG: hypothetical protein ACOCZ8_04860 [Bacteroidota bacterium]
MYGYHIASAAAGKRITVAADQATLATIFRQMMGLLEHHAVAVSMTSGGQTLLEETLPDTVARDRIAVLLKHLSGGDAQFTVLGESCGLNHTISRNALGQLEVETMNLAFVKKILKKHALHAFEDLKQLSSVRPELSANDQQQIQTLLQELKGSSL